MKLITRDQIPSLALSIALLSMMSVAVIYSPTLYRMFCAATGYGGTVSVNRSLEAVPDAIGPTITVRFDTNVAPGLDWDFRPEQVSVVTHIGLPTTVYFLATNKSDRTIVGRATYNVTPGAAGFYFTKTQCFCFEQEKLAPGETARMPVVFYVDPEMLSDIDAKGIHTITLSYTFFDQASDDQAVAAARPLKSASEAQVEALKSAKSAEFSAEPHRK